MEKYKTCPSCKAKNPPALLECMNCETDLTGIKITDEETERINAENSSSQEKATKKMVRVCGCGVKNAPNSRKCSSCNEDISDIVPTPDVEEEKSDATTFVLSSLDGQYAYKITTDELIVGRENIMSEYLSNKSYVSRYHAKFSLVDNELYIDNLSNTNFTYVNNQKITARTKLQDGDQIGLGGTCINGNGQKQAAYFIVRIERCM